MALRLPPQNLESEQSVLGAMLIDPEAVIKVADFLHPEHFYENKHAIIFSAILELYEKRRPIDLVTVPARLKRKDELTKAGGVSYLTDLVNATPTSANIEAYAHLIKDAYVRRSLISVAGSIGELGFDNTDNVNELLDKAEMQLFGISQEYLKQDFVPIRSTLETSFDRIEELHKTKGSLRGVPTGLKGLDKLLNGLQESNLVIMAGRPSVGKSALALNIAQFAAVKHNLPVGIFSLEMSRDQLVDRMLSKQSNVDNWKISTGNLTDDDFKDLGDAMGVLAEAPIYIDDTPGISVMEMRTKARRLHMDKGVKLIIVDYLQLVRGRNLENRVQEVSEISQALKNLARELKVPVLACAQLSRAVEQRGGKVPQLSDLRESGSIEQDSDVVAFLYRPDDDARNNVKLLIAKHRNGPTGELDLFFKGSITKFFEAERREGE
ncbi:replicative DNA helicase [Candidatus Parcubacteria bacterium]|nr:replicative DNA helicase [Patescibacteria group bacterium]MBU4381289.1 replicative DNA helicase [Patescibacteria group bacterium]MCG2689006.1 replicative DNA helicase [Candidatus Parcubacteria bacterium]